MIFVTDSASTPNSVKHLLNAPYHSEEEYGYIKSTDGLVRLPRWGPGRAGEEPNTIRWNPKASIAGDTIIQPKHFMEVEAAYDTS